MVGVNPELEYVFGVTPACVGVTPEQLFEVTPELKHVFGVSPSHVWNHSGAGAGVRCHSSARWSHTGAGVGVCSPFGACAWSHSGAGVWSHSGAGVRNHSGLIPSAIKMIY